ncbi:conserved hypothetical protein [Candida dubliniensis CD36]|uniref:Uncharacterized protein n=1 Tax=Candida dubliniensis (strain CD36 / ATCC MYA-646 / CBS 7987 / NCPF 3949 / NRRL Y-17841) TaxID=573826 RepID=B9W9N3_CANDC|nr:conserved hypothetical protein [Candida dubliniensis CD36]CAX45518.1 conserved hypothetical protein [Candida dubliniensis CD36]
MAFPLDQSELIRHLRTTYLVLNEDSDYARRIIKHSSLPICSNENTPRTPFSDSPPITFEIARHIKKSVHNGLRYDDTYSSQPSFSTPPAKATKKRRKRKSKKTVKLHKANQTNKTPTAKNEAILLGSLDENNGAMLLNSGSLDNTSTDSNMDYPLGSTAESELAPITESKGDDILILEDPDESNANNSGGTTFGLRYTKTIRGSSGSSKKSRPKSKSKIPIVKFFSSGKESGSVSDSDSDSDSDINDRKLQLYQSDSINSTNNTLEEVTTEDGDITEQENEPEVIEVNKSHKPSQDNSDVITIDSDFGVPVNSRGHVVQNYQPEEQGVSDEEIEAEIEEDYDSVDSDEYEYEYDEDGDEDSNDSEFTDLDNDSLVDSSLILDSTYNENGGDSFSFVRTSNVSEFDPQKSRKKKKSDSFDQHTIPKSNALVRQRSSSAGNSKSYLGLTALSYKNPTFKFEKIVPSNLDNPKTSKLSSLIHSKYKSNNTNPLNYYSFVDASASSVKQTLVDIFVPPNTKATLTKLAMVENVAISDCIGFILLNLCKLPESNGIKDLNYLNPNHWRLELVDEDGENYGSFGVLDRTRLLSSYNNPKELAICRITDYNEIKKNEAQSPLPVEVKKDLEVLQRKRHSINQIVESGIEDSTAERIEFQIGVFEYDDDGLPRKEMIKVPSDYTMGQVLKEFCAQQGLILTKYRFRLVDQSTGQSRFVKDVEKCSDLKQRTLELIPSDTKLNSMMNASYDVGMIEAKITPSDFTLPNITPTVEQIDDKMQKLNLKDTHKPTSTLLPKEDKKAASFNSTNAIKQAITSNKYLENILTGDNPALPINLNTIYFKWKVLKNNSKMKIKNFSEKNFIIDGDYIHLTPPDDLTMSMPVESSVININGHNHTHHHNYLNHQFNRAHNKTSTKTYSFHITQILKLKKYVKNPNYFRIIIQSQQSLAENNEVLNSTKEVPTKKFYLIAINEQECSEIISKLKWVLQVYNFSSGGL